MADSEDLHLSKNKRHKKQKKHKKHKSRKHEKGSASEDDWVEVDDKAKTSAAVRDEWMNADSTARADDPFSELFAAPDHREAKRSKREDAKEVIDHAKALERQKRELNPNFHHVETPAPAPSQPSWRKRVLGQTSGTGTPLSSAVASPRGSVADGRASSSSTPGLLRPESAGWTSTMSQQGTPAASSSFIRSRSQSQAETPMRPEAPSELDDVREAEQPRAASPAMTEEELNQLAADVLQAEIMGQEDELSELRVRLERQRRKTLGISSHASGADAGNDASGRETILLTQRTRKGTIMPARGTGAVDSKFVSSKKPKTKAVMTHDKKGERIQYFGDDSQGQTIQDLVQREKLGLDGDFDSSVLHANAATSHQLQGEDYTVDDMFVERAARGQPSQKQEAKRRDQAVKDYKKHQAALDNCWLCVDSRHFVPSLVVAMGASIYIAVPDRGHLGNTHCVLVPRRHVVSTLELEEDEMDELEMFQKFLVDMYRGQNQDVVFLETSMNLRKQRHTCIQCVPLSLDDGAMAPMFFKKAINESDTTWAQNKKLVDTTDKGIARSIPKGFPFFHVRFGVDRGFGHVIEDEQLFPHYFGQEIVGGMLDLSPNTWLRPQPEEYKVLKKRVDTLKALWKPFDWTEQI